MDDWPPEDLSEDEAYELVAERHRRETLRILLHKSEQWDVSRLATTIAAREADVPPGEVSEADRKRVTVALLHRDLPKLADADVIEFDFDDERVETGDRIDDLDPLL